MYKLSTYRTASAVFSLNHVPLVLSGKTLKKWHTWKYHKFLLWYDLKLTVAEHLVSDCYHLFCHPSIHAYRISILISNFYRKSDIYENITSPITVLPPFLNMLRRWGNEWRLVQLALPGSFKMALKRNRIWRKKQTTSPMMEEIPKEGPSLQ